MASEQHGYVKSFDGSLIWYRQIGTKGPFLVLCDGVGCQGYVWKYFINHFSSDYRILHWNYRGHGQTPAPENLENIGIEINARDLSAILGHLQTKEQIIVVGHSMGVQVALEFYHQYPKHVSALIALTGPYGRALNTLYDSPLPEKIFPYVKAVFEAFPDHARNVWKRLVHSELGYQYAVWFELNRNFIKKDDFFPYLEDLSCMDPLIFLRSLESATRHNAEAYLVDVKVPTLVIAAEKDRFTPLWVSEKMAAKIPKAELLIIPTASHTAPIELPDLVNLRCEKFLTQIKRKKRRRPEVESK